VGLFAETARIFHGRAGGVFLSAALALAPAYLVGGGLIFLAARHVQAQRFGVSRTEAYAERTRDLPPDATADQRRDILRGAQEPGTEESAAPRPVWTSLALIAGVLFAVLVVTAGLFLAQAGVVPLAGGSVGPGGAWATVAARFPAVTATGGAALGIVAVGLAACILPGLFAAFAFSLAMPAAVAEGLSGFPALQRSWQLMKRAWPAQLGILFLSAVPLVLLTQGLGRLLPEGAILRHALLDAAIAAVLLPWPLALSVTVYLRARSAIDGTPLPELIQYIRRISAPG